MPSDGIMQWQITSPMFDFLSVETGRKSESDAMQEVEM